MRVFLLALFLAFCYCGAAERQTKKRYDGHSVLHVRANDERQLGYLHKLHRRNDMQLDFWKEPRSIGHAVEIAAEPEAYKALNENLRSWGMEPEHVIDDIQKLIDKEKDEMKRSPEGFSLYKFNRHSEINQFLNTKVEQNPYLCSTIIIGQSTEGRDLQVLKISLPEYSDSNKKSIWVDAGIHAREWIAPATALWIIEQLITTYEEGDFGSKALLETYDWYFLPVVNPDGYEYSHEVERYWRKTRSNPQSTCPGVDANRNWDFHWMEIGASQDPCSNIYAGTQPFSEPETKAVADYLLGNHQEEFMIFVSLHCCGEFILTPWGYTSTPPDDYADLEKVANATADAIYKVNGARFTIGSPADVMYPAAGGSYDWAKGVAGIKYSYIPELRGSFIQPTSQIILSGEEIWAGIKMLALEARRIERLGERAYEPLVSG